MKLLCYILSRENRPGHQISISNPLIPLKQRASFCLIKYSGNERKNCHEHFAKKSLNVFLALIHISYPGIPINKPLRLLLTDFLRRYRQSAIPIDRIIFSNSL